MYAYVGVFNSCHHYLAFVAVQSCMIGFHQPTSTHMIIYNDWLEWLFFYLCSRVVLYVKHCRLQVHLIVNRYVEICAALGHGLGSERRSCATSTKGNMIHTSYMCNIHIDIYMHICLYKYANTHTHTRKDMYIYLNWHPCFKLPKYQGFQTCAANRVWLWCKEAEISAMKMPERVIATWHSPLWSSAGLFTHKFFCEISFPL